MEVPFVDDDDSSPPAFPVGVAVAVAGIGTVVVEVGGSWGGAGEGVWEGDDEEGEEDGGGEEGGREAGFGVEGGGWGTHFGRIGIEFGEVRGGWMNGLLFGWCLVGCEE